MVSSTTGPKGFQGRFRPLTPSDPPWHPPRPPPHTLSCRVPACPESPGLGLWPLPAPGACVDLCPTGHLATPAREGGREGASCSHDCSHIRTQRTPKVPLHNLGPRATQYLPCLSGSWKLATETPYPPSRPERGGEGTDMQNRKGGTTRHRTGEGETASTGRGDIRQKGGSHLRAQTRHLGFQLRS